MRVLHVLQNIRGTTIPVEIATAVGARSDVNVRIVSVQPLPDQLPDTVREELVLKDHCPVQSYADILDAVAGEFDAVHTHKLAPAARVGFHARWRGIPHVNTQHGHIHYTLDEKVKNLPGLVLSDALVYNSNCTAHSYNAFERGCKAGTAEFVVHNGVNTDRVGDYEADITSIETVVTAARLIRRKNLGMLVRSLDHIDGVNLRIVGDGDEREQLAELARTTGVRDRVEFLGYLPNREDVYSEMAAADVFALPSHGEGFGVSVAEAMGVGLPVVISDLPIFHEIVGPAGRFVDRQSPERIAAAIADFRVDPDAANEAGRRNRERIFKSFSLEACAQGYRDVYQSVLNVG